MGREEVDEMEIFFGVGLSVSSGYIFYNTKSIPINISENTFYTGSRERHTSS